jgi:hypothetical protein
MKREPVIIQYSIVNSTDRLEPLLIKRMVYTTIRFITETDVTSCIQRCSETK